MSEDDGPRSGLQGLRTVLFSGDIRPRTLTMPIPISVSRRLLLRLALLAAAVPVFRRRSRDVEIVEVGGWILRRSDLA